MKILKTILVLSVPIIAVLINHYLSKESSDVRYTLSKGIPISSLDEKIISDGSDFISVQEIKVKNIGNKKSENIEIKINKKILQYDIFKNSTSDKYEPYEKKTTFELVYSELIPDGEFTLVIKTRDEGINKGNLSIYDQNGLCKQALVKSKRITPLEIIYLLMTFFYFCWAIHGLISFFANSWKADLKFNIDYFNIIERKKPFYVKDKIWNEAITEVIEKTIHNQYYYNIEESLIYRILCSEKPDSLKQSFWNELIGKCQKELENKLNTQLGNVYPEKILKLLKIQKPKHFLQNKWDETRDKLNSKFIENKLKFYFYSQIDDCKNKILEPRPNEIDEDHWNKYIEYLKDNFFCLVSQKIEYQENPVNFLEKIKLDDILSTECIKKLKKRAYEIKLKTFISFFDLPKAENIIFNKPDWMQEEAYIKIKKIAYKFKLKNYFDHFTYSKADDVLQNQPNWMEDDDYEVIKIKAQHTLGEHKYSIYFKLLNQIISNQELPLEKPKGLTDQEWDSIFRLNSIIKRKMD